VSKVKSGQFHPIGGCWIEHDTNLPNGESLVRQFLYGQRFFESNFGTRSTTCWLPDSFGFSSQLPQLCRQAGMNRFLTQKPCFNSVNDFPHTTFNWYVNLDCGLLEVLKWTRGLVTYFRYVRLCKINVLLNCQLLMDNFANSRSK
jgi:hypothetical protein